MKSVGRSPLVSINSCSLQPVGFSIILLENGTDVEQVLTPPKQKNQQIQLKSKTYLGIYNFFAKIIKIISPLFLITIIFSIFLVLRDNQSNLSRFLFIFLTTLIIYALFFMMEESTPNPLKIVCGFIGGTGIFIFLKGF